MPQNRAAVHSGLCAAAVFSGALAHLWMVLAHPHQWWQSAVMLAMAAACLPCAAQMWRAPSEPAARMAMGAGLAMAGFHTVLLLAGGAATGHESHGRIAAPPVRDITGASFPAAETMLLLTGWELGAALLAATWLDSRRRRGVAEDGNSPVGAPVAHGTGHRNQPRKVDPV